MREHKRFERHFWGLGVQGPNEEYFVVLSYIDGWHSVVAWLIDQFPSRICCGNYTWRIFMKPVHWALDKTMPWWQEVRVPVSKELAMQIDADFVGIFDHDKDENNGRENSED